MVLWYRPQVLFSSLGLWFVSTGCSKSVVLIYGIVVQAAGPLLLGCGLFLLAVLSRWF